VPESQLKQFIERLTGGGSSQLDEMLAEAENHVAEGQAKTAMALYQEVLSQEPGHVRALAGALSCLLAMGQEDQARDVLAKLPDKIKLASEIASIVTQLELKDATADAGDPGHVAELEAKVAAEPKNMDARMELAMAYYGANTREKAAEALLEMVAMDRTWNDEAARKQLVKLFEAFGPKDPLTAQGRRRLSSLLFS
jgi:putative thioredoxin